MLGGELREVGEREERLATRGDDPLLVDRLERLEEVVQARGVLGGELRDLRAQPLPVGDEVEVALLAAQKIGTAGRARAGDLERRSAPRRRRCPRAPTAS
jgi:hypothetical protein